MCEKKPFWKTIISKIKKKQQYQHYELEVGNTAYLFFDNFTITLDFFPGEPRVQVENEGGELVQELNWDDEKEELTEWEEGR